jgi:hypothetical protein
MGVAVDVPHHPIADPLGDISPQFVERCHRMVEVCLHDFVGCPSGEGVTACQCFVIDAPNGIDVRSGVERLAFKLLGRHEKDGAEDGIHGLNFLTALGLREHGEPKVHDLDLEFSRRQPSEHDVAGLQVAVNQVEVLCGNECFLGLQGEFPEIGPGEWGLPDDVIQGFACDEFHDDVGAFFVAAEVMDGNDVRMLERSEGSCLFE